MIQFNKRAALWASLFLYGTSFGSVSAGDEVLKKIEELVSNGQKLEASQELISRIYQSSGTKKAQFLEILNRVHETFLANKTQKNYELANSIVLKDPKLSLRKVDEALAQEPHALLALKAKLYLLVRKGKCREGAELFQNLKALNPFDWEAVSLRFHVHLCLKNQAASEKDLKALGSLLPASHKWVSDYLALKLKVRFSKPSRLTEVNLLSPSVTSFIGFKEIRERLQGGDGKKVCQKFDESLSKKNRFDPEICRN